MTFKGGNLCSKSYDLKKNSQQVLVSFDVSAKNLQLDGDPEDGDSRQQNASEQ
jgi:hypothetical protein